MRAPALALLLLVACGDDDRVEMDAGPGDGAVEPLAPAEAALPSMTPCPDGWREVSAGSATVCEPWPEGGRTRCLSTEALLPGGCTPLPECPVGDFAEGVGELGTDVRFVLEGAAGDGSEGNPYGTISQALAGATPNTVIALGKGSYIERVGLPGGVDLVGACARETFLRSDEASVTGRDAVLATNGEGVSVRGLTVQSGTLAGIRVVRSTTLEDVVVEGARTAGIIADPGSTIDGSNVTVRGTRVSGPFAMGVAIGMDANVTLRRASLTENVGGGVSALGATVVLEDTVIADNGHDRSFDIMLGKGIEALDGTQLTATRCVIEDARTRALFVEGAGTVVRFERSLFRNRVLGTETEEGRGWVGFEDTEIHFTQSWFDGFREVVARPREAGMLAVLEDVVFHEASDAALSALGGAEVRATRVYVSSAGSIAFSLDTGSRGTVTDLVIEDSRGSSANGNYGTGIQVTDGSRLEGERVRVSRARMLGLLVGGDSASEVVLQDLVVEDTLARACVECGDPHGDGVVAIDNGSVDLTRFRVAGSTRAGLHAAFGQLAVRDGLVESNTIGAAIQTPGFDLMRINERVVYRDNLRRVDSSSLPVETAPVEF
ncbi:MAG: right-handed parallel beta-helix repeat-containing protein [Deltaproteobacteria bacterium]|nr:right-handed parallel beta-helix repeat-containing protein [Deltaproteobacteria bacterium]